MSTRLHRFTDDNELYFVIEDEVDGKGLLIRLKYKRNKAIQCIVNTNKKHIELYTGNSDFMPDPETFDKMTTFSQELLKKCGSLEMQFAMNN